MSRPHLTHLRYQHMLTKHTWVAMLASPSTAAPRLSQPKRTATGVGVGGSCLTLNPKPRSAPRHRCFLG
jgi:hypothetical protein